MADVKNPVSELLHDRQSILLSAVTGQLDQLMLLHQSGALGDGFEACALAAANGQLAALKYLVGAGCDIARFAARALPLAAANGRLEIVKYFREQGCDLARDNNAAIKAATFKGQLAVVRYLHQCGGDIGACLAVAERLPLLRSHQPVIEYLAAHGVFVEGPYLLGLLEAIRMRDIPKVRSDLKNANMSRHSRPVIQAAVETGDLGLVRFLHENGCDIRTDNDLALRLSAERGFVDLVRYLHQENAADIHLLDEDALRAAATAGHWQIVKILNEMGADISRIDAETITLVELNGHARVFNYLTESGFDTIAAARPVIAAMRSELYQAGHVYHPSKLWEFFNDVNMEQLRRDGINRFKRSINQNYFNFVPQSLFDPQLLRLLKLWMAHPTPSPFKVKLVDPDLVPNDRSLVRSDKRVFKFDNRSRFLPRVLQDVQAAFGRGVQLAYYRGLIAMLWDFATANDKLGLAARLTEPRIGSPIETYFRGRIISQDLAHSIIECNSILNGTGTPGRDSPQRIAEIGAGYGRLGYVLLQARKCQYVVFDIPPSLYVSQWYLGELFPEKRFFHFRHFDRFEEIAEELAQADVAFFSANQIELMPAGYFDIGINISSLHELRPDQIDNMLRQIYRVTRSLVYLKQYKEYLNPHDGLRILEDAYPVPRGWRHRYYRDDAVDARFFETLVENEAPPPRYDAKANSSQRRPISSAESGGREPTISVLLANYNHAQYLPTALAGICGQTCPATEIIVIDDGSTDDSVAVIGEFAARNQNMRLLQNGRNRGQLYSIQRALVAARGDYVVWASADDLLLPDFLERSRAALREHPAAGLCFSRLSVFVDGTSEQKDFTGESNGAAFEYGGFGGYLSPERLAATLRKHYVWISGNTVVARRAALLEIGGFEQPLRWHADWFAYYVIALRYGACVIPETLALMRERRETYSGKGIANPVEQGQVLTAILDTMKSPRYYDLLPVFRRYPSILSPFGKRTLFVALRNPRHWNFVWPLACWYGLRLVRLVFGTSVSKLHAVLAFTRRKAIRAASYLLGRGIVGGLRAKFSAWRTISRGKP